MKTAARAFLAPMRGLFLVFLGLATGIVAAGAVGCAGEASVIYGTRVQDTEENRKLIDVCEQYRIAVEKKDTTTIMSLASKNYWEDGGTPTGADDYGFDGLRSVLDTRFARADGIRYTMKYMDIRRVGRNRAVVDVMIDATYSIATASGPRRLDMRDQNELMLEYQSGRWQFLSGM
jgi:hypothetical protein